MFANYNEFFSSVIPFALFLLAGAFHNLKVVDQTYQIPPNNWRYIDSADWRNPLEWRDAPAIIRASFKVESGPAVRLMIVDRASLERVQRGEEPTPLRQTISAAAGALVQRSGSPNDCILLLENRGAAATASVHLAVTIDSWDAAELSPERRLAVLAISFCVFFGMLGYAGAKLWRAAVKR
jgi:hypothetical protein